MTTPKMIAGPDQNPVKPSLVLPEGACDSHCHIFGPGNIFPYHPNRSYTPPDAGKETLKALHDHLGISRAVIVHASCHGTFMDATLDAIASSNGNYRGTAMVEKDVSGAELRRLHEGGIRAVRFNFVKHLESVPDPEEVRRMADRVKEMGWHLVVHLDAVDIDELSPLLLDLPVPFLIDHMARVKASEGIDQPAFKTLLDLMGHDNAWVKICGGERVSSQDAPFHDAIPFAQALIAAAPTRVLWGTDFPHPNVRIMPNDGELVNLFGEYTSDPAVQKKILVENPSTLYFDVN
ncbi:MAG: amidohydrolase family protein [Chloroflexi bacterium]|nr:amidohydrolase family protein [Chloroflexota bacterium]MDA1173572.1 amidohydrolase family protein [Chloroflexota bacterium]